MKQAAREAYKNKMHHNGTMKKIAKAYLSNGECSVQEALYHILPKLKLRRTFQAVYFVKTNPPGKRVEVLLSDDSPNIFKKSKK